MGPWLYGLQTDINLKTELPFSSTIGPEVSQPAAGHYVFL
jgi:hypothetical protein